MKKLTTLFLIVGLSSVVVGLEYKMVERFPEQLGAVPDSSIWSEPQSADHDPNGPRFQVITDGARFRWRDTFCGYVSKDFDSCDAATGAAIRVEYQMTHPDVVDTTEEDLREVESKLWKQAHCQ